MDPLISVIVPVYNVKAYLRECLDSILRQSYRTLEIIVVDDGSQDGCAELCDAYAAADSRIRVIHQSNGGLSAARNAGMDAATGAFWSFVDSDDAVSPNFIQNLYRACADTGSEIAMCRFCKEKERLDLPAAGTAVYTGYDMSLQLAQDASGAYGVTWNKLYRADLFSNIRFPDRKLHEDEFTTYKLFWKADHCAVLEQDLYYYRQRPDSIVNSAFSPRHLDAALAYRERAAFYQENGAETLSIMAQACYCHFLRQNIRKIQKVVPNAAYWKKEMMRTYRQVLGSGKVGLKKKAALSLQMLSPALYQIVKGCK